MIHTHSFLALGLICVMWLLWDCFSYGPGASRSGRFLRWTLLAGLAGFSILWYLNKKSGVIEQNGILIMAAGLLILGLTLIYAFVLAVRNKGFSPLLRTWGLFALIALALAAPQLFFWTFSQADGAGFIHSHFNWSNNGSDFYLLFWIKNLGLVLLLLIPAFTFGSPKDLRTASPLLLIWFIAELVAFQPNNYDNNKLMLVAFVFMCGLAADLVVKLFSKKWRPALKAVAAACLLFLSSASALMTMAREAVSKYQLYGATHVEACRFIEANTPADAVFLTYCQHNNAVASLTGRNIVCGAGTFLYYHGIDYRERQGQLADMYADPQKNAALYRQYGVDYVYVSDYELNNYTVNTAALASMGTVVFQNDGVTIYQLTDSGA